MGDVKLAGLIGVLLGRDAGYAIFLGVVAGGVAAAVLLLTHRGTRKTSYAYGPYLAFGTAAAIVLLKPPALL
jgi:leader peptidase (prepilin peptidase)/N-methyltransferase